MILTLGQLVALAQKHGFPDPHLAAAIAMVESAGGNTCAQGDPNIGVHPCDRWNGTSQSIGLWQINIPANKQYKDHVVDLLDPDYNARAAYALSTGGTNWRPWSTAWEDANHRVGYLGPRAPFMRWYTPALPATPLSGPLSTPNIVPPRRLANRAPIVLTLLSAAALAAAAGYGTHYGRQWTRARG